LLTTEENEFLARIGPDTPAGALLRRYWQPLCVAAELTSQKPSKRTAILGEDLVAFRDQYGNYGCVAEHCARSTTALRSTSARAIGASSCYASCCASRSSSCSRAVNGSLMK
jgi:hypothetical protein